MSKIDTGGPAFPVWELNGEGLAEMTCFGMTLRDYFAAKALPGLMVRNWSSHKGTDEDLIEIWARSAYRIANAMLSARGTEKARKE